MLYDRPLFLYGYDGNICGFSFKYMLLTAFSFIKKLIFIKRWRRIKAVDKALKVSFYLHKL